MNPSSLRQFAKRYGMVGLVLVGIYLVARHLWTKKRVAFLACLVVGVASTYALDGFYHRCVSRGGYRLYVGRSGTETSLTHQPLELRVLQYWEEGSQTERVRALVHAFARAVAQQDRVRAIGIGNQLGSQFRSDSWNKDGKWLFRAVLGQTYLEQRWVDEAEQEFQNVLRAVPPGEPDWGKSLARQISAYGLARTYALRGSYTEALTWLARAPGEYNGGCGNANEAEAVRNYPLKVVWASANKPFSTAVMEFQAIMEGRFTPMENRLNGDTSEEQKQHAAVEAGLTLGCLYYKAGRRADAESCWNLVADNVDSQPQHRYLGAGVP